MTVLVFICQTKIDGHVLPTKLDSSGLAASKRWNRLLPAVQDKHHWNSLQAVGPEDVALVARSVDRP